MLQLDVHADSELLDVERARSPVDAELLADGTRIVRGEGWVSHLMLSPSSVQPFAAPSGLSLSISRISR